MRDRPRRALRLDRRRAPRPAPALTSTPHPATPAAAAAPTPPKPAPAKPPTRPAEPTVDATEETTAEETAAEATVQLPVDLSTPAPAADTPSPDVQDDTTTDPIERAGAALDARAARKPKRDKTAAEARGRRREQKRDAKEQKRQAKRAQEEEREDRALVAPAEALVARLPAIKPVYAALLTGVLTGLSAVLLTLGASKGCEAVRDTSSCGGGVGLLAVVAILAVEVLIGANLLKAWQISDPFSTSFLGVGMVAIIAMLTFLSHLDSPWMLLVIPLMTAVAFAFSWWVTVRFVDEHPMASEVDAERGEPAFAEKPATPDDASEDDAPRS
ncbi:hypothetical protein ACVW00_004319 [Marmoricola sp. URHA0025 HA25]